MFNKIMKLCEDNNLRFYFNSEIVPGSIKKRGYFRFKRNDNELGWAFTIFNTDNEYFEMELEMRLEEMLKNLCNESEVMH